MITLSPNPIIANWFARPAKILKKSPTNVQWTSQMFPLRTWMFLLAFESYWSDYMAGSASGYLLKRWFDIAENRTPNPTQILPSAWDRLKIESVSATQTSIAAVFFLLCKSVIRSLLRCINGYVLFVFEGGWWSSGARSTSNSNLKLPWLPPGRGV